MRQRVRTGRVFVTRAAIFKGASRLAILAVALAWVAVFFVASSGAAPLLVDAETARFAVIGDFGTAGPDELAVANLVDSWNPDFVATVGDNNYPDGAASTMDANVGQYYHQYIYPYVGSYGAGAPDMNRFFPALGNHDWRDPVCVGSVCTGAHFDYFDLPGNERYYDLVWGPVHLFFVSSDPHEPDGVTSDSVQAAWLQAQLAASTAPWKLVFLHHSPYSSSGRHGSTPDLQWPYKEWGASAVLSGHDHDYERLLVDGLPYFVDGLGGDSRRGFGAGVVVDGSQVRYSAAFGALLLEADATTLRFRFYDVAGNLIDDYLLDTLNPPGPGPTATPTQTPVPGLTPTPTPTGVPLPLVYLGANLYSVAESDGELTVDVLLSEASSQPVNVTVTTSDISTLAGSDYMPLLGTELTFPPGQMKQSVNLTILADQPGEADELLRVTLSDPKGANLDTPASANIIIHDSIASVEPAAYLPLLVRGGPSLFSDAPLTRP